MSDQGPNHDVVPAPDEPMPLAEFLESIPPTQLSAISDMAELYLDPSTGTRFPVFRVPEIQLHCPQETCNGKRFFRCIDKTRQRVKEDSFGFFYVEYACSNCQKERKTFSLAAKKAKSIDSGEVYKFGEVPIYGPPTPARLIKLIGPERELFLKGRRCEDQGLGIGAFVYYRRVVESQKSRILGEIIKVSEKLNIPSEHTSILKGAQKETQFSRAMESVKDVVPQSLLINGYNPMLLLHKALSQGLHNQTDESCLENASSIRIVLAELADKLSQALRDEAELNNALTRLMAKKNS